MTISVLSSRRVDNLDFGKVFCTSAGKTTERRKNSFRRAAQKKDHGISGFSSLLHAEKHKEMITE